MRYLRTNTATRITVGPFLDQADGITPEVALTVTSEKLTFMVDTAGVPTLILDAAPTASGGANDMVHVTNDDSGFYDLELAAADVNYLGRAMLSLNNVAAHCPVFHEFMILPAVIYDAMVLGTDLFDVSMTQLLGTAVSTPATAGIMDVNTIKVGNTAQTAGDVPALVTTVDTVVDAVKAKTDNLPTAPADDTSIDTQLATIAGYLDTEIAAILAAVDTEVAAIKAKTDNLPAAPADDTSIDTQLATIAGYLDTEIAAILAAVDTEVAAIKAKTDNLPAAPADDTSIDTQLGTIAGYLDTEVAAIKAKTDNLPAAPAATGDIPTAAVVADAVWDEVKSGHVGATTFGDLATDVDAVNAKTTNLPAAPADDTSIDTQLGTIAGYLDTEVAAIKAKTDNLPAAPADDTSIDSQLAAIAGYIDTEVAAILAAVDTEVAAIKAKTDNLPAAPADDTSIDTQLATIAGYLDTEVAAIKAVTDKVDTGLVLDGAVYQFTANALELAPTGGSAPTVGQIADAVWDEDVDTSHQTAGTAGKKLDDAGAAADPWATALPGSYGAGTAGKIIGDSADIPTAAEIDTQLSGVHGSGRWGGGNGGDKSLVYTLTNSATNEAVEGATVELYASAARTGEPIDQQITDVLGQATFNNLVAGTYYLKIIKAGFSTATDVEVVA